MKRWKRSNRFKQPPAGPTWRKRALGAVVVAAVAAATVAVSAVFVFAYQAVTGTTHLAITRIEVNGCRRLEERQVLELAGVQTGDNLLSVNLALVHKRLVAHGWIRSARVARRLPDTIVITIEEHRPVAVLAAGDRYLIDAAGSVFKRWQPGDPENLPLIEGLDLTDAAIGPAGPSAAMAAVCQLLAAAGRPDSSIALADIARIRIDRAMGITVEHRRQGVVLLGYGDFERKLQRLGRAMAYLARRGKGRRMVRADLTDPDRLVLRMDTGPASSGKQP